MSDFPGLDALSARIADLAAEADDVRLELEALGSGLPQPLEDRLSAVESELATLRNATASLDRIVQIPDEGMIFDAVKGFLHFLDAGTTKNEFAVRAKDQDPSAIRIQARHDIMGKLTFDFVREDGIREEKVMIQGRLGKARRNAGEIAIFLNDGQGGNDENMKEAAVLGFDENGDIGFWVNDSDPRKHISYSQFSLAAVPPGVAPIRQESPAPPEPTLPPGTDHTENLVIPPDASGWWTPVDSTANARLIQQVDVTGKDNVVVEVYLTDQAGVADLRVDVARVRRLDAPIVAGVQEFTLPVHVDGTVEVDVRVTVGVGTALIRNVRAV